MLFFHNSLELRDWRWADSARMSITAVWSASPLPPGFGAAQCNGHGGASPPCFSFKIRQHRVEWVSLQDFNPNEVDGSLLMPFNLPRRLLKLFNTSRHQNGETLPVELWYHIASMVEETADLSRLYRTSRTLQAICQQDLYESIRIYIEAGNQRSINSLLRAMQNPRLADLVIYFYVHIAKIDPHGPEVCDRLDKVVGGLVAPMRNLQELACVCKMRCQHFDTHHLYFQRLETKVLKKLYLGGECFHRTTSKILSTPCMRGITSLILAYKTIRNLNPEEQALVEDDSFLPCLRELSSPTFRPFMTHIRKGSLTSIGIHSNTCDLSTAFSNSLPGAMHLVHLGVESLLPSIMNNPSPFLKLRTMSRFTFNHVRNVSTKSSNYAHFWWSKIAMGDRGCIKGTFVSSIPLLHWHIHIAPLQLVL